MYGYEIHKSAGKPSKTLLGHLDDVSCIACQNTPMKLYSGPKNGMILSWGSDSDNSYNYDADEHSAINSNRRYYVNNFNNDRQQKRKLNDVDNWSVKVGNNDD